MIISLQANSPEVTAENIDQGIIHLIKHKRQEVISIDKENNSNAAIRIMKRDALYQKSLSTYLGCIHVDATDIHTIKDIKKFTNIMKTNTQQRSVKIIAEIFIPNIWVLWMKSKE